MDKLFTIGLVAILVIGMVTALPLTHTFALKTKEKKALKSIDKALIRATEGKPSTIDLLNISRFNDSSTIVVINNTGGVVVVPPPPPPVCLPNQHVENGMCVPNEPPTGNVSKVCLVGDLVGNKVPDMMKNGGCNLKIGLGDLGYGKDLSYFKGLKFDKCVVGNHDAKEDGDSNPVVKEALAYCKDHWWLTIAQGTTIIIGLNTNGDPAVQLQTVKELLSQNPVLNTVIIASHKAGHVPPNSHHPAEAKSLYASIEALIPSNIKLIEVAGHNHVMSAAHVNNWYQSGAGGKSHYECGTDAVWTFCDNKAVGYLELTVDNKNGDTTAKFIK